MKGSDTAVVQLGVLARFDVHPGSGDEVAEFFRSGLAIVEAQPVTTVWFAFRISDTVYGAFSAFATAEHREALLAGGGPQLSQKHRHLFTTPPTFERVDVLEARLVRSDDR